MSSKKRNKKEKKIAIPFDQRSLLFKVSEKKAISIYGLNRFPVTLYKDQMIRLLDSADDIRRFIEEHNDELASKKDKEEITNEISIEKVEKVEKVENTEENGEIEIKPF